MWNNEIERMNKYMYSSFYWLNYKGLIYLEVLLNICGLMAKISSFLDRLLMDNTEIKNKWNIVGNEDYTHTDIFHFPYYIACCCTCLYYLNVLL